MPDEPTPPAGGEPTGDDAAVVERVRAHLDEVAATPLPPTLAVPPSGLARDGVRRLRRRRVATSVAAAAAVVVLLGVTLTTTGEPDGEQLELVGPTGSSTTTTAITVPTTAGTAPVDPSSSTTTAPGETTTTAGGAPTTVPGGGGAGGQSGGGQSGGGGVPSTTAPQLPPSTTTSTTAPPGSVHLVDTGFTDTAVGAFPAGWTTDSGSWIVTAGPGGDHQLTATDGGAVESRASTGSSAWSAYEAVARVRFGATGKLVGIGLRYQGANDYLFCKIDRSASRVYLGVFAGGSASLLGQSSFTPAVGATYTIRFRAVGSQLSCSVDGGPSLTGSTGTFGAGRVALLGQGDASVTSLTVDPR